MTRIARVVLPGVPHHVTQRGNRRERVFFSDEDYALYRDWLAESCARFGVEVWAYCQMPNHAHLILAPGFWFSEIDFTAAMLREAMGSGNLRKGVDGRVAVIPKRVRVAWILIFRKCNFARRSEQHVMGMSVELPKLDTAICSSRTFTRKRNTQSVKVALRHGRPCPGHPRGGRPLRESAETPNVVQSFLAASATGRRGWPGQARP